MSRRDSSAVLRRALELSRDILALADAGHADQIAGTRALETWFRGQRVYRAP